MPNCSKCGETDPDKFSPSLRRKGTYCRKCQREYTEDWKRRNPDKVRANKRKLYHQDVEKSRREQREWRARNPDTVAKRLAANRAKAKDLGRYAQYRHGIRLNERNAIQASQGNCCAICRVDLATVSRVCIDHNYATGGIRGILCNRCNTRLGWFEGLRETVIYYLDKPPVHPGKPNRPDKRP